MKLQRTFRFIIILISGIGILSFNSCKRKLNDQGNPIRVILPGLNPEKLTKLLFSKVSDSLYKPIGIFDHRFSDTLKKFYIHREGNPVWVNLFKDSVFKVNLNSILTSVEDHGLQEKFYNKELIFKMFQKFDSLSKDTTRIDYELIADLDYLLSSSLISLYKDLSLGRIDPAKFYNPYYDLELTKGKGFNIFAVLQNPISFCDSIYFKMPSTRRYHGLQTIWKYHRDYKKTHKILDYDTSQEINSNFNLSVIDQRLEFFWNSIKFFLKDTNVRIQGNRELYVSKTSTIMGLNKKVLDSAFISEFVIPSNNISDDVLASLERERWFSEPDTGTFLYVSLTDFIVTMYNKDTSKVMRVCVGKRKPDNYEEKYRSWLKSKNAWARPIDSETPQIGSKINYVIINPTWTVPNSIIGKEMFYKIVKNPDYLTAKGYEVLSNGKVVDPKSVEWKKYSPYRVPVKIRQKSGNANSLGKIKFSLPNRHNIYLHDTPEKSKFGYLNRAVSHGCVRLHQPIDMAEFLLGLQGDTLLVDKFRIKMGLQPYDTLLKIEDSLLIASKKTESIKLNNPIPVYLVYKTIIIGRNGDIHFNKDIYRKNEAIAKKLRA